MDYLKDAKQGILKTSDHVTKWSFNYAIFGDDQMSQNDTNKPGQSNLRPSTELESDAEEFLLNLNIFSTSLHEQAKSARSTMNLFAKDLEIAQTDDNLEFDLNSLAGMSQTSSVKNGIKIKRRVKKSSRRISSEGSLGNNETEAKKNRSRRRRERKVNDFYCISFDNELSETSGSSSSSASSSENFDEDDEDLTATSVSSSATINNESDSINSTSNPENNSNLVNNDSSRQLLIDFLFNNEENREEFLNTSLNNFLTALDQFFSSNNLTTKKKLTDKRKLKREEEELGVLCDQIMDIYNDIFKT